MGALYHTRSENGAGIKWILFVLLLALIGCSQQSQPQQQPPFVSTTGTPKDGIVGEVDWGDSYIGPLRPPPLTRPMFMDIVEQIQPDGSGSYIKVDPLTFKGFERRN
jgi:hypothetical protein